MTIKKGKNKQNKKERIRNKPDLDIKKQPQKAIIWDFDGTIADTMPMYMGLAYKYRKRFNLKNVEKEELLNMRDKSFTNILKEIGVTKMKLLPFMLFVRKKVKKNIKKVKAYDGVEQVIKKICSDESCIVGIVTSNSRKNVDLFLRLNGMRKQIDFIEGRAGFQKKTRTLRKVIKKHRLRNTKIYYIGDEIRDVDSSKALQKKYNIQSVAVTWGMNSKESLKLKNPEYLVDEVDELEKILL